MSDRADQAKSTGASVSRAAFDGPAAAAVMIAQRVIGVKSFED